MRQHLAVDIGATGGKVYLGTVGESTLGIEEVHRFDNRPVQREDGRYVWDVPGLVESVVEGIGHGDAAADELDSVGVDTWGVDFGLFADGELIQNPYSYRDPTAYGRLEELLGRVDKPDIFGATGLSHWQARNSLWQYYYLANYEPGLLEAADTLLMMPGTIAAHLGGRPCADPTIASTTQMFDPRSYTWATDLLDRLDLPTDVLPEVAPPGTEIGELDADIAADLDSRPDIVLPGSHDTASAVAAMPFTGDSRAFLATGTVFIMGVEIDEPNLSAAAGEAAISNEIGVEGTVRFLKNLNNGFFLLEECREVWAAAGGTTDYADLLAGAAGAEPLRSLVDPEAPVFDTVEEMPAKIRSYCEQTDQPAPRDEGEMTRCILESLATKTSLVLETILAVAGEDSDRLHLGGGGVRNELFCRMVAGATGMEVVAGPSDAAAIGNILLQARAAGTIDSVAEGRRLVDAELALDRYEPAGDGRWTEARERMRRLETFDIDRRE